MHLEKTIITYLQHILPNRWVFAFVTLSLFSAVLFLPSTVFGSEVQVDSTIYTTNTGTVTGAPGMVCVTALNCYVVYREAAGTSVSIASSTDGGITWSHGVNADSVNTADAMGIAVWWDGWTGLGTTTQYIHIATIDTGVDDVYYTRYDITTHTLSTSVVATTQGANCTAAGADCFISITKTPNNVIYMAAADTSDSWVVSCAATCTTAGNWSERTNGFYQGLGDDFPLLTPIPGTQNILLTYWDISQDTLLYNVYSATSSSWFFATNATQTLASSIEDNTTYDAQLFGTAVATTTGLIGLAYVDDANDYTTQDHDVKFSTYSSTTGWVAKTDVVGTASGGIIGAKVAYDVNTARWYVFYGRRTTIGTATTGNIYFKFSTDDGTTWSAESLAINDNADDINGLTVGNNIVGDLGITWNYTTAPRADQQFYGLVATTTISGTLYSDEGSTPITAGNTIRLAVGTTTISTYSTTTDAGAGTWSFKIPPYSRIRGNTPVSVWVDGNASTRAVTVTKLETATTSLVNLDLYQNRVIARTDTRTLSTTTIPNLAFYDSDDDTDIQYTANTGTLIVKAGNEFHIWKDKMFFATGSVTVRGSAGSGVDGSIHLSASSTFISTSTVIIAGNLSASTSALWGSYGSTTFNATTTGKTVSAPLGGQVFFNGIGGGWTVTPSSYITNLTIATGTAIFSDALNVQGELINRGTLTTLGTTTVYGDYTNIGNATHSGIKFYRALMTSGPFSTTGTTTFHIASTTVFATATPAILGNVVLKGGSATLQGGNPAGSYAGPPAIIADPSSGVDEAIDTVVDDSAIYVTGYCTSCGNKGSTAWVVYAYDKLSGAQLWSTTTDPTASDDQPVSMTLDDNKIYIVGYCNGCGSVGSYAGVTLSLNKSDGSYASSSVLDVTVGDDHGNGVKTDDTALYVVGHCTSCGNKGNRAWTLHAYNKSNGGVIWSTTTDPTANSDDPRGITIDSTAVYVTGVCTGCGMNANEAYWTMAFNKYTGAYLWATSSDPSALNEYPYGIAEYGNTVYVAGYCSTTGCGGADMAYYVIALNKADGTRAWHQIINPSAGNESTLAGVEADSFAVYVAGDCTTSCGSLGGNAYRTYALNRSTGATIWSTTTDPSSGAQDFTKGMALDASRVYVTGRCTDCGAAGNYALYTVGYYTNSGSGISTSTNTYTVTGYASTTNLQIGTSTSDTRVALSAPTGLTIGGDYVNNARFINNSGTVYVSSTSPQTLSGTLATSSAFNSLILSGASTKTFASNASSTNLSIQNGTTMSAPPAFTISGAFINAGTFTHNSGTAYFSGGAGTASGTLTGTSAFNNLQTVAGTGPGTPTRTATTSAGTGANDSSFGAVPFSNPESINGSDDLYAEALLNCNASYYLQATNFGFSIPEGSTITGITASIERYYTAGIGPSDDRVRIVKGGVVGATNMPAGVWGLSDTVSSFGTSTHLWGETWTSNDINASDFGFTFSAFDDSCDGNVQIFIDDMQMSVYYTPLGSNLTLVSNASTSNLVVNTNTTVVAPAYLSLTGNYTNNGTFTAGSGTTTLSGTTLQTATGTLTGSSAFNNLEIINNSASTTFNAPFTVNGHFKATTPNTRIELAKGATTTLTTANIAGTLGNEVWLRSSTHGTQAGLDINGAYTISYTNVKDSHACGGNGSNLTGTGGLIDSGNNLCWTFSVAGTAITISGFLYADEGSTTIRATKTIKVAVGTTTPGTVYSTTTTPTGTWHIDLGSTHAIAAGIPITIFVDGDAATRAVLVTKASTTGSIGNLPLYQNRVIVKHEGLTGTSTTLADMDNYDSGNDSDVQYITDGSTLTVNSGNELYVYRGTTFAPQGAVSINGNASTSLYDGSLRVMGTYTPSATTTVAGNFYTASSSIYTPNAPLVFTATSTGKYITHLASTSDMGNVRFEGTGNLMFLSDNATTSHVTIASGTVTPPMGNLVVQGHLTQNGQLNYQRGGVLILASTSAQTVTGIFTGTSTLADVILRDTGTKSFSENASTSNLTIEGFSSLTAPRGLTVTQGFNNQGTFTNNSGTLYLTGASTTLQGTLMMTSALNHVTVNGPVHFGATATTAPVTIIDPGSGSDIGRAIVGDAQNTYVASSCNGCGNKGGTAFYVTKISKVTGAILWATTTDVTASNDTPYTIAADEDFLYVTGMCTGCGSLGGQAMHTVKYRKSDSSFVWATTTDPTSSDDGAYTVALDHDSVYITGTCTSCGTLGNTAYYTVKYAKSNASLVWATTTDPQSSADSPEGMAVDQDYVYVTGYCTGCGLLGNGSLYTVKYSKVDGARVMATTTDVNSLFDSGYEVVVDATTIYVAGHCYQCGGVGTDAIYLIAYSKSDMAFRWSTVTDVTAGSDYTNGLTQDDTYLYLVGECTSCGTIGGVAGYVAKYRKSSGQLVTSTTTDFTSSTESIYSITLDQDYLYTAGFCSGCGTVGSNAITVSKYLKSTLLPVSGINTFRFAQSNASTTDLIVSLGTTSTNTIYAPSALSIRGNFAQGGQFVSGGNISISSTTGAQAVGGNMTGTNALGNLIFSGGSEKILYNSASTTNLTIGVGATVTSPYSLTVGGNYTNSGALYQNGTLYISSASPQSLSGNLAGTSSLGAVVLMGGSTKTFSNNASTSNLTIQSGNTLSAPAGLTATTLFNNTGTFTNNSGTLYLIGASTTATGTLTNLYNLVASGTSRFVGGDASTTIPQTSVVHDPSSGADPAYGIVADQDYLYVTGQCLGCGSVGSSALRTVKYAKADGSIIWATTTDPTASGDQAYTITADSDYLYVSGICNGCGSLGSSAYYTIKYLKADGSRIWATTTDPGSGADVVTAISTDQDSVYVTGYCTACGSLGSTAYYTIKYSKADGSRMWATTTDITTLLDQAYGISVDQDAVYVTGYCFGCGSLGNIAYHTVKYSKADGTLIWATTTDPTSSPDLASANSADSDYLYVTGYCTGCGSVGGGAYYTIKYLKADGSRIWATTTDMTASSERATAISAADNDAIYVTGFCTGCGSLGAEAYLTVKYAKADGSLIWATTTDQTAAADLPSALTVDQDYVYVTGYCTGCGSAGGTAYNTVKYLKSTGRLVDGNNTIRLGAPTTLNNLTIGDTGTTSTNTLMASSQLSIGGNFVQGDVFNANGGTTTLNGTALQTATGTMTGTSAFYNLALTNSSASTTFNAPFTVTNHFQATTPSTRIELAKGATTTLNTVSVAGTSGNEVKLHSTTPGIKAGLAVQGAYNFAYVNVKDSSATNTLGLLAASSYIDSGNNNGWDFVPAGVLALSSAANQTFAQGQSTTSISTITIADAATPGITAANDIRIKIATSTVRMLWDTTDTTAIFDGTASGKVSNPVSYEGGGSVLVIPVGSDFSSSDTLTVRGLSFSQFSQMNSALNALTLYTGGVSDVIADATDDKTVTISGSLTLANHDAGQTTDTFTDTSAAGVKFFRYKLTPSGENATLASTVFTLAGVSGISQGDLTNFALYRDINGDGLFGGEDTQVGGAGAVAVSNQTGTITFSSSYSATTSQNFILVGDYTGAGPGDRIMVKLDPENVVATGATTGGTIPLSGSISQRQHIRGGGGSTGSNGQTLGPTGGDAPTSTTPVGGGGGGGGGSTGGDAPTSTTPVGGGGGGGGGEVSIPSSHFFATAYLAIGESLVAILKHIWGW